MDEDDRPATRETPVTHETTVINTGGERGGGGTIVALLVLALLAIGAFLFFGGYLESAADDLDVNVNVSAPNVELPDVTIQQPAREEAPAKPAETNSQ